jgi:spore coat protein A, manganese oxidase
MRLDRITQKRLPSTESDSRSVAKHLLGRWFGASASVFIASIFLFRIGAAAASPLVSQTQLKGNCFPKFAVALPVFGPASTPRVDAAANPNLTITMKEIDQSVLPQGTFQACGKGVKLGKTRVWAYETKNTSTGDVLGPANWPAVTIDTQRGIPTEITFVNQLPSFNPADPTGPGLVQGVLPVDQTLHWADPLQTGCGMMTVNCSQAAKAAADTSLLSQDSKAVWCGRIPARGANQLLSTMTASSTSSSCCEQYTGPVPTTVHLHGAEIAAAYDGGPNSWFTPDGKTGPDYTTIGNPGAGKAIYQFQNSQEAGTLWFHDHALGVTRDNAYAGLAGFYFIRDPQNEPKNLPSGPYEIELNVQDRSFDTNSQLYFPVSISVADHPNWSVIFEGDVATVNGAAFPYLKVEPRRYRFRILNGSNNRAYTLGFGEAAVYQIGADDNYFDKPVKVTEVPLAPAERADLIVDFSKLAGTRLAMTNTAIYERYPLPRVMQFRVALHRSGPDDSCKPNKPDVIHGVCARKTPLVKLTDGKGNVLPGVKIDKIRQLVVNENFDYPTNLEELLNNTKWDGLKSPGIAAEFPTDGVSELPREGSIELWEIANIYSPGVATQTHPIHLHLSQFQVLNRQALKVNTAKGYFTAWNAAFGTGTAPLPSTCTTGQYCPDYGPPLSYLQLNADGAVGGNLAFTPYLVGKIIAPEVGESGWKDTAVAYNRQVLRLLVRWTPSDVPVIPNESYAGQNLYLFDPTQGYYVWHCHLINHEDNEMMRPYKVTP